MELDSVLELESYCDYLLQSNRPELGVCNPLTQMRQLGKLNNLRYVNGLPMIYEITEESIGDTLRDIGRGSAAVGKGLFTVAEVVFRGLEAVHTKLIEATANADNVNKKSQHVLSQAKRNGVKEDGQVSIASGDIQFNSKIDFESIKAGFISAKEHLPKFISWYKNYYNEVLKEGNSSNKVAGFKDIHLPGDMMISLKTDGDKDEVELVKAPNRLKTVNKVNVLTLSELEEIAHLTQELAVIIRSSQLDTTVNRIKDYVKRVKDQEEQTESLPAAIKNVGSNTLIKIVDHLLDSCITALKYCEHSTY